MRDLPPFAIFCSGRGSNALALCRQAIALGRKPDLLLVNRRDAAVLDSIKEMDLGAHVIHAPAGRIDKDFEQQALALCREFSIKWVFLAGFMKILSLDFLNFFKSEHYNRVLNIHPSLLPDFPGLGGYEQAFKANKEQFGFTIHLVDELVDHGAMLCQCYLKRREGDTVQSYEKRGLKLENHYYPIVMTHVLTEQEAFIDKCLREKVIYTEEGYLV